MPLPRPKPRRTVRIGLWTGEEEGLLGSKAYVTKHFGYYTNITNAVAVRSPKVAAFVYNAATMDEKLLRKAID